MPTNTFLNLPIEKKNKIIEAAIEEFCERNIYESKIAIIMKNANISRGSFYNYFDSIEDLYFYVVTLLRNRRFEYLEECWNNYSVSFFDYFEELYLTSVKFLLDNPHYIKISKHLYASDHKVCIQLVMGLQKKYSDMFMYRINLDKQNGVIKKNVDTEMLANIFVQYSSIIFVYETRSKEVTLDFYEDYINRLLCVVGNGVLSEEDKECS